MVSDFYNGPFDKYEADVIVTEILRNLGLPRDMKGYSYIKQAILCCVEDKSNLLSVTKTLYPNVAKIMGTDSIRVERSIRHTITAFWDRQSVNNKVNIEFFGTIKKPTNSQFIAAVTDRARVELRRK